MIKRPWTDKEKEIVRSRYSDEPTADIARDLGRTLSSTFQMARKLGFTKSEGYLSSVVSVHLESGRRLSVNTRFKKGQVPHNKGQRRPGYAPGRMKETQFAKGNKPHGWRPIGSTRLNKDGIVERKVSDAGDKSDWIGEHILEWTKHNGPVPDGHAVVFKTRDKSNTDIGNLELLSRAELMRRNTVHRLPKELALVIQIAGALNRKIRSLDEKQNDRSAQSSL